MSFSDHNNIDEPVTRKRCLRRMFVHGVLPPLVLYAVFCCTSPAPTPLFPSTGFQKMSRREEIVPYDGEKLVRGNALEGRKGTSLGNHRLETVTDVSFQSAIAYDIMEINYALVQHNYDRAWEVYIEGENSRVYMENGEEAGKRTLGAMSKGFAISADEAMNNGDDHYSMMEGLNYIFSVYGLAKGDVDKVGKHRDFAHLYVKDALEGDKKVWQSIVSATGDADVRGGGKGSTLASEAMVVLNLWMFATHKVWSSLAYCRGYGPEQPSEQQAAIQALDEFAAYWYGSGFNDNQSEGITDLHPNGFLLYDLAEKASNYFGTSVFFSDIGEESVVNTQVWTLYHKAISLFREETTCNIDVVPTSPNYQELYRTIQQIISQMQIPLLQHLIHALYMEDDKERIKMYAMSIVPQLISVSKTVHGYLQYKLIDDVENYNSQQDFTNIVKAIYSTLFPLGISCEDIGQYYQITKTATTDNGISEENGGGKKFPPCIDPSSHLFPHTLANYNPGMYTTTMYTSPIDLDILQIKILMKMGAHHPAKWIYESGRHSFQTSTTATSAQNSDDLVLVLGDGSSSSSPSSSNTIASYLSLKQIATNREILNKNTWHSNYVGYMNGDDVFGDTLVSSVFSLSREELKEGHQQQQDTQEQMLKTRWTSISQHTEIVSKTLQYLVLQPYAISLMYLAVEKCFTTLSSVSNAQLARGTQHPSSSASPSSATSEIEQIWDEAVSYLIGSLEGIYDMESEVSFMYVDTYEKQYGLGLYSLANARCSEFQTCSSTTATTPPLPPERANVVSSYRDLFYTGKGQIESLQCDQLLKSTVKQVQRWSLIPIIQSVIRYAIKGEALKSGSKLKVLAEGEIFALVIIPLLHHHIEKNTSVGAGGVVDVGNMKGLDGTVETDRSIVERNMIVQPDTKPVQDGAQKVAQALSTIVRELGLPCEFIGGASGISPCDSRAENGEPGGEGVNASTSGAHSIHRLSLGGVLISLSLVLGGLFAVGFWKR